MTGNWWFPWDIFIVPQGNGDVWYYAPDAVGLVYSWDAVNQVYVSPPGQFDVMSNSVAGTWTRTTKDGVQWHFNAAGFLDWVRDRHGLQNNLARGPQNQITSFTDYAGRTVNYNYNGQGRLTSLVDFNGRTTSFAYTLQGYLASITYPPTTYFDRNTSSVVTRGRTVSYQYISGTGTNLDGNLTAILDDRGKTLFAAQYDAQDRSTTQTSRGRTWTVQYAQMTRIIDPDGITTDLYFNANGSIVRKDILTRYGLGLTPLRSGEPTAYSWLYSRNAPCGCEVLTGITRPDGSFVSFGFDVWGNMTSRTLTPAPGQGSPETETWNYSGFLQFCRPLDYVSPLGNASGANPSDYKTTWSYNMTGDCVSATFPKATINGTPAAPAVTMSYNTTGQMTTFTDQGGTVTKLDYAPVSLALVQVTEDFGTGTLNLVTHIGRDLYARETSIIDPNGNTTTLTWSLEHELIDVLGPQPLAGDVKYLYDNNWALYSIDVENKDSSGNQDAANPWITTSFDYDVNNRPTAAHTEIDASTVATTTYDYTAAGRLRRIVDPVGNVAEVDYDERGLVFTNTDGAGSAVAGVWRYDYDGVGGVATMVNPRGYSTTYARDVRGRPTLVTRADGCQDRVTWDLDGHNTRLESLDAQGTLRQRTECDYDAFGLPTTARTYHVNPQGQAGTAESVLLNYDAWLRPSSATDAVGATTTFGYDAVGRRVIATGPTLDRIEWSYDNSGNVTQEKRSDWNQATSGYDVLIFDHTIDALDRPTGTTRRDSSGANSTSSTRLYDSRDNLTGLVDALGNTRSYAYDARNLLLSTTHDLRAGGTGQGSVVGAIVTQTVYDAAGRVVQRLDGAGGGTQYAYDARGRVTTVTNPVNGMRSFTYDVNGNVATAVDPNGSSIAAAYDSVDRVTSRSITRASGVIGTTSETIQYDDYGRPTTFQDDDTTVAWTYDYLSRIATETEGSNPLGQTGRTFSYAYDAADALVGVTYPDTAAESVSRDASGRVSQIQIAGFGTIGAYQYSGARVVSCSQPSGVVDALTFDALRRPTWRTTALNSTTLFQYQFAFDAGDHRLLEKRHHAGGVGDNYVLDSLYRTTTCKAGVADPVLELQTPGSQSVQSTTTVSYDAVQSRLSRSIAAGGSTTTTNYGTDGLQFYTSVGGATQVRDANGNLVDDGTNLYDYDYRDQLCRVRLKATGATVATYDYDMLGRRVGKSTAAGALSFVWAGANCSMVYDSGGVLGRFHYGALRDEILFAYQRDIADINNNSSTTDYVGLTPAYDGSFNCVGVLDQNGAVVESYVYAYDGSVSIFDAAGQPISASAVGWQQGHGCMWRDDETGFSYARRRYYSPALGRFVTKEPSGDWFDEVNAGNGYGWCGNRYANGWDPTGRIWSAVIARHGQSKKGKAKKKPTVDQTCPCNKKKTVVQVTDDDAPTPFWDDVFFFAPDHIDRMKSIYEEKGYKVLQYHFWGDEGSLLKKHYNQDQRERVNSELKNDECVAIVSLHGHGYADENGKMLGEFRGPGGGIGSWNMDAIGHTLDAIILDMCGGLADPSWNDHVSEDGNVVGTEGTSNPSQDSGDFEHAAKGELPNR
jgi:RHS repeat-associated protein